MRLSTAFVLTLAAAVSTSAAAQSAPDANAPETSVFDGDYIMLGVGGFYRPSYVGSDDGVFSPVPLIQGKVAGITINPRAGGLGLDLIPDGEDPRIGFSLGPVASYSRNRAHQIKDPVVRAAGKLKSAVDIGVTGGVTAYKLLSPYDRLTLSADVMWNVNSAYEGMTVTPALTYVTPVSRAALVTLSLYAKHVDDDYADYYLTVSPAQSAASGLPLYQAGGGWSQVGANVLVGYDLDGDMLNGGLALFALGGYGKLLNDSKHTPYTSIRGDDNQWTVGGGVAYTF